MSAFLVLRADGEPLGCGAGYVDIPRYSDNPACAIWLERPPR